MLRSVSEIAELTGFSKVSIYNKLKLKDISRFVTKSKGITYVSEEGLTLILDSLKLSSDELNSLKLKLNLRFNVENEVATDIENTDVNELKDELKDLKQDYIKTLKSQIENFKAQIYEKDNQIRELMLLNKNNQVLLKQEKEVNQIQLEEHIRELDIKLNDVKENMDKRKEQRKGLLKKCMFWVG
ncbi:hypothetical protein FDB55_17380 [Clostridium botulinum]|uniref:hypothetical protein n=1 Tax=Clostridium botulinum TaxID=1491 RepID=UPI0013F043BC|nr:hypothetical protein [Clostridium botulinum]MCS6112781.1 hypothetical protein [Clostridium botulinum]NFE13760.1 hypothetical protein [Clostridium botulinum]NFE61321.1 hypothetical protein [Clostridium botulinum]NFG11656.1 hypothetical protein [Clostridium botulinum]NFL43662.1 hypothetical protein [Clostridium botulinum]